MQNHSGSDSVMLQKLPPTTTATPVPLWRHDTAQRYLWLVCAHSALQNVHDWGGILVMRTLQKAAVGWPLAHGGPDESVDHATMAGKNGLKLNSHRSLSQRYC